MLRLSSPYGPVNFVEDWADVDEFRQWLAEQQHVAVDTETTGLDIFTDSHAVRLVQFGNERHAYLLDAERWHGVLRESFNSLVARDRIIVMHNATYDMLVLHLAGLFDLNCYNHVTDTAVLAHLVDPRAKEDGGIGHSLKGLAAVYVDEDAPDGQHALKALFKEHKWTWATVPIDDPTYLLYSGIDVQLTLRLFRVMDALTASQYRLRMFEHRVQEQCAKMQLRGVRIDVDYAKTLLPYFDHLRDVGSATAAEWGIDKVNSPAQVAAVLQALGVDLLETTPAGAPKVDKEVLQDIINNADANPNAAIVAEAVQQAKRAGKNKTTYVEKVLAALDAEQRVHPWIHPLQARTARMSISTPPLQQLPSGDWRVRRMFVPDEGHLMLSVDYSQVELRVLAVLADERKMIEAINAGQDLHDTTATALFGPDFTKAQRKLAKNVGFGRVYGGGATTLARQAGTDLETAKRAMAGYDSAFPGIKRYSNRLVERARAGKPQVTTPAGRVLPLDRWRLYAATNYVVQSTARDVLANALLELDEAGLGDYLLLPIHDEVLAQAPAADAQEIANEIAKVMTVPFGAVSLDAEPEVYGTSWGHGYGAPR